MEAKEKVNWNIIFLDIDGVLNCQLFYNNRPKGSYVESNICRERVGWLNELCADIKAEVVISSTWRMGKTVEELREIFKEVGATFNIIDKTPVFREDYILRGNEIHAWIKMQIPIFYSDYKTYAIIDDDSDMLLWQRNNFFQTDTYSGLTPNTCYRIKRFFNQFDTNL